MTKGNICNKNKKQCPGCKKIFKSSRGATQHMKNCPCIKSMKNKEEYEVIDDPVLKKDLCEEKKYFICDFCYEFINKKKNKIEHEKRCLKKFFLKKFKRFFDYVFGLVLRNNNTI